MEDTPERVVFETPRSHSRLFAGCMMGLIALFIPLGLMLILGGDPTAGPRLVGAGMIVLALGVIVKMIWSLRSPRSVYQVVLEPPLGKVTLQTLVGSQAVEKTTLTLHPNPEFEIFASTYEIHGRYRHTRHATNLCHGEPAEALELCFSTDSAKTEAFTNRLRRDFGIVEGSGFISRLEPN